MPAEYAEYYNKNNDFVGWIKIDGTEIDYPVVQGADNDYYLLHNFEKESRGTIFMAYDCDAELGSKNTVIHGHNWLDDSVFSPLVQYSDFEFYKKHPVIEFNTRNEMHKWKIIAVFITSADENEDNGYVFNYVYPNMGSENFKPYSEELKKRTLFDTGVDYNESDKFLTFSTCTREVDKGKKRADCRIVIVSRMVRENETAYVDTSKSIMNENPKYPQIWYNNKGLSKIINNLDVIVKGLAGRELPAPVEPTDPAEPTDPTDPTNPTKPSEPTTTPADNTTKADTNNTNKTVNNAKIPNTGAEAETAFTAILSAAAGVALLSIVAAYTLKRKARNI